MGRGRRKGAVDKEYRQVGVNDFFCSSRDSSTGTGEESGTRIVFLLSLVKISN